MLSFAWQTWLAENLLAGARDEEVLEALLHQGVPQLEAQHRIGEVRASPVFAASLESSRRAARRALVLGLHADLLRRAHCVVDVPRRRSPPAAEFFDAYFATNTPVVLTDVVPRWPAFKSWTPQHFGDRFANLEIEIIDARDSDPDYDINYHRHRRTVTFADYIARIQGTQGESNDFYMIANNGNIKRPELRQLFQEVVLPHGYFDDAQLIGGSALWIGPAGTVTPLHHDTSSILFCQVYGRKRVRLISPFEFTLLETARDVYNTFDCEAPPVEGAPLIKTVDVAPGEALFIPAGWWHHVRSLDVSISLAFNNFRRDNCFEWYKPGALP